MASLTFDMAPACDPGEPEGTEIGDEPIGGCPESEGGIIGGIKDYLRLCFRLRRSWEIRSTRIMVFSLCSAMGLSHSPGWGLLLAFALAESQFRMFLH